MNRRLMWFLLGGCALTGAVERTGAQEIAVQEREIGPHQKVIERLSWGLDPEGQPVIQTNTYTALETGMHIWNEQTAQWQDAVAEFELFDGGVIARRTQHQLILAPSPTDQTPVDLQMPDGQRLQSQVLGLGYFDQGSGQSIVIAEVQDSQGILSEDKTEVIYPDAFKGEGVSGDLRYTLSKAGMEQDVVLWAQPPGPEAYGLDPETSQLMVISEFLPQAKPNVKSHKVKEEKDARKREVLAEPDVFDDTIEWPTMMIGPGKAFAIDDGAVVEDAGIPVAKQWQETPDGRTILFESVGFADLLPALQKLPEAPQAGVDSTPKDRIVAQGRRAVPPKRVASKTRPSAPIRVAQAPVRDQALVLDYLTLNSSQSNYRFKGDLTYYISGNVTLSGTTVWESASVLKFAPGGTVTLTVTGPIQWQGTAFRPVVLTARDDHAFGEKIGSSSLSGYYAGTALYVDAASAGADAALSWLRISHAQTGIYLKQRSGHVIRHAQFVNCQYGLKAEGAEFRLRNAVFDNVQNVFYRPSGTSTGRAEHLTVATASTFKNNLSALYVTNSILAAVTTPGSYSPSSVSTYSSTSGVFQSKGRGNFYLAGGSADRNNGTTNLNADLAKDLRGLTTYPPVELTSSFTTPTTLSPQAARDTDTPDRGYHYAPLDYVWTTLNLSSTLTLTNGVAVGIYGPKGVTLGSGAKFISEGTPLNLNRLVGYQVVQEQSGEWGTSSSSASLLNIPSSPGTLPEVRLRFTDISVLANTTGKRHLLDVATYYLINALALTDCQVRGAYLYMMPYYNDMRGMTVALTNNVCERVSFSFTQGYYGDQTPLTVYLRNNLFRNSTVTLIDQRHTLTWAVHDNLFEAVSLGTGGTSFPNSHNGYSTGMSTLPSSSGGDKTISTFDYQTGPLGAYYYPTTGGNLSQLISTGSRTATAAGLYHYTTATSQTKEGSTQVDIGYHYVAVDANGQPLDTDGDGLPDYFEDRDGDGNADTGETHWQEYTSMNGLSQSTKLITFTPLR